MKKLFAILLAAVSLSAAAGVQPVQPTPRPAYNTGCGFYVVGGKVYDPTGVEFRIRGVNRVHWNDLSPGIPNSGANTERISIDFRQTSATNLGVIQREIQAFGIVPMVASWNATGFTDAASLSAIVDLWVAQASTWTTLNCNGMVNIANEWGADNSTSWRDGYLAAIPRMRAAGYTGLLVIDAGVSGQSAKDIANYGQALMDADPQHNLLFDVHMYGAFHRPATASWMQDYDTAVASMGATGLPIIVGEFGPGRNIGPSPTLITPDQIVITAESNGWGWMPWAWDDFNGPSNSCTDDWFGMARSWGAFDGVTYSQLTLFGQDMVTLMKSMAVKAHFN